MLRLTTSWNDNLRDGFRMGIDRGNVTGGPCGFGRGELGAMRARLVEGDGQVWIAETGEWVPASVNTPLVEEMQP